MSLVLNVADLWRKNDCELDKLLGVDSRISWLGIFSSTCFEELENPIFSL